MSRRKQGLPYEGRTSRVGIQGKGVARSFIHEYGANYGNQWSNADACSITAP